MCSSDLAKGELLDSIEEESSLALVNADDCVIAGEAKRTKEIGRASCRERV